MNDNTTRRLSRLGDLLSRAMEQLDEAAAHVDDTPYLHAYRGRVDAAIEQLDAICDDVDSDIVERMNQRQVSP